MYDFRKILEDHKDTTVREDVEEIYALTTALWYKVADEPMKRCGHPGVAGFSGEGKTPCMGMEIGHALGAIGALNIIIKKLKRDSGENYS